MADQRPIRFWLGLVDHLIEEQFATTLDEHGVTRRQWQLLNVLARGTATVEELEAVGQQPDGDVSAVEHLTELIESAWVDATATGYELTERGRIALERLTEVVAEQQRAASLGISGEEEAAAAAVLERMARNLGWND